MKLRSQRQPEVMGTSSSLGNEGAEALESSVDELRMHTKKFATNAEEEEEEEGMAMSVSVSIIATSAVVPSSSASRCRVPELLASQSSLRSRNSPLGRIFWQQSPEGSRMARKKRFCQTDVRGSSSSASPESSLLDEATILELPCLPFSPTEVFIPSSSKTLHLYESRFLSLLDEVMAKGNSLFAHIVIEPVKGDEVGVASFVAAYGCLARIESVKQLEIGALVSIRGIGRIKLVNLTQMEPFIKSKVMPVRDGHPADRQSISKKIEGLLRTLGEVQQLQIKIKTAKEETLQTPLEKALQWAEKGEPDTVAQGFVPCREERISFAALQPIAGASPGELHKLLQERLKAMSNLDTEDRLANVTKYAEQSRASVAAKVALQSLQL